MRLAYWIAFGPHGPREEDPPDKNWQIFKGTVIWVGASCLVFFIIRQFARTPPKTMTKEWQEMTNEYLKVRVLPSAFTFPLPLGILWRRS